MRARYDAEPTTLFNKEDCKVGRGQQTINAVLPGQVEPAESRSLHAATGSLRPHPPFGDLRLEAVRLANQKIRNIRKAGV